MRGDENAEAIFVFDHSRTRAADHPLRRIRRLTDTALRDLDPLRELTPRRVDPIARCLLGRRSFKLYGIPGASSAAPRFACCSLVRRLPFSEAAWDLTFSAGARPYPGVFTAFFGQSRPKRVACSQSALRGWDRWRPLPGFRRKKEGRSTATDGESTREREPGATKT